MATNTTPFSVHGKLHVDGANLVDAQGNPFMLYGMSSHGIAWYPEYINKEAFLTLRDEWNTNCVRLAMYTDETDGYCTDGDKEKIKQYVKNGVQYATELGMYVIIDWHILFDQTPNRYKAEALKFFEEMSALYKDYDNVLYEICNEPNQAGTWDEVTSYANEVIPVIRANAPESVILVGTPTWSQDIHLAYADPLKYENLMYSLHFYAATHTDELRGRVEEYVQKGLPVFVSEFGMCDASGNGGNDFDQTSKWMALIDRFNLSHMCWNLANRDESSSVFKADSTALAHWADSDLNESGAWIKVHFQSETRQ